MGGELNAQVEAQYPPEIDRILSLPRRQVVDCERDEARRWSPIAQALVEVVTAQYTRGPRLSCGCQKRTLQLSRDGVLTIFRQGKPGQPPPMPVVTTVDAFLADNAHASDVCKTVNENLRPGYSLDLPGLGASYCLTELNAAQAWTLRELPQAGGIFGIISVGGGKSISGILAPLAMPGVQSAILLAKPDQRFHYRNLYLRLREHFRVPTMSFDQQNFNGSFYVEGAPVLRFVPYSQLSNAKSTELLESYMPDMIIADESHLLAARASSRTLRFLRYMASKPNVVFCNWSGSTVKKSLKDCSHLAAHALGMGSPYPIRPLDVDKWANVIDPVVLPDTISQTAVTLYQAFAGIDPTPVEKNVRFLSSLDDALAVREGFRERIIETPGVISTRSSSVTASITINIREAPKLPEEVRKALSTVRNDEMRPDGEVLVETIDIIMCAREVASGWFSYWSFPKGEPKELIDKWYDARKHWNKALRRKIILGEANMDSPMLCTNAAIRAWQSPRYDGDLPVWPEESWLDWAELKDQVDPDPRVKWIDDFLAKDAAAWANEHRGIVWCQSRAFGKKVAQLAGINYHGGGVDAEEKILAEDGKKSIVASINAHGTGRDLLQAVFYKQLIAEPPSSADRFEQLLGRLCRQGQEADTVETWVYAHVEEFKDALRKAKMFAEYIEATTPNKQLLLAADGDWDEDL